jgi:8-oxo-dGTP pyrophosphatase MutT (NUDIX family)
MSENTKFKNRQNTCHNISEGKTVWEHRSSAVVTHVVIQKQMSEDEDDIQYFYLIGKRGNGVDNSGLLNIPCGHIDWDETLEEAAKREIWEECDFDVDAFTDKIGLSFLKQPWFVNSQPTENRQNIALHTGILFVLNQNENFPTLSLVNMEKNECMDATWMNIDDIENSDASLWAFNHNIMCTNYMNYISELMNFQNMIHATKELQNMIPLL